MRRDFGQERTAGGDPANGSWAEDGLERGVRPVAPEIETGGVRTEGWQDDGALGYREDGDSLGRTGGVVKGHSGVMMAAKEGLIGKRGGGLVAMNGE